MDDENRFKFKDELLNKVEAKENVCKLFLLEEPVKHENEEIKWKEDMYPKFKTEADFQQIKEEKFELLCDHEFESKVLKIDLPKLNKLNINKCKVNTYEYDNMVNFMPEESEATTNLRVKSSNHLSPAPREIEQLCCAHCYYKTIRKDTLIDHLQTHFKVPTHKCTYCDYSSPRKNTLNRHMLTHTTDKTKRVYYICTVCKTTFTKRCNLQRHLKSHSEPERTFECNYCKFCCTSQYILKNHISTHTGERPYQCSHCDFASARKYTLSNHMVQHTGDKRLKTYRAKPVNPDRAKSLLHKCPVCTRAYPYECQLICHMRTHTGERPFTCFYCGIGKRSRSDLKYHIITHTKEPLIKCPLCDFSSFKKQTVDEHRLVHHLQSRYNCAHCDYRCLNRHRMESHMKKHTLEVMRPL